MLNTKSFEKHYCGHWTRDAGGWGGLSPTGDAVGGGASSEDGPRALTREHAPARGKQDCFVQSACVSHA